MPARDDLSAYPPDRLTAVVLGADAGGSHSTVAIGREDGTVLGRAEGPGAAMRPGGAAASAVVLVDTARRAGTQAGVSLPVDRAVVGAAGAGRDQEQRELAAALVAAGIARAARVLADAEVALATAFQSAPGVIINAGTGSIAYARDDAGRLHRCGGYGWQLETRVAAIGSGAGRSTPPRGPGTAAVKDRPFSPRYSPGSVLRGSTTSCAGPLRRRPPRWPGSHPTCSTPPARAKPWRCGSCPMRRGSSRRWSAPSSASSRERATYRSPWRAVSCSLPRPSPRCCGRRSPPRCREPGCGPGPWTRQWARCGSPRSARRRRAAP